MKRFEGRMNNRDKLIVVMVFTQGLLFGGLAFGLQSENQQHLVYSTLLPGGGNLGPSSVFNGLSGGNNQQQVDPAQTDTGTITKINANLSAYENTEHGFAFEFPGGWNRTTEKGFLSSLSTSIMDPGLLSTIKVEPYIPEQATQALNNLMPTATLQKPSFEVKVVRLGSYLDPDTLQVRNNTAEEFGKEQAYILESMGLSDTSSVPITQQILKNEATTIANKSDAWRIDYITSVGDQQSSYNIQGYVIDDEGKLYKLKFTTSPTTVPELKPEFEKILKSFRFL